MNDSEITFMVIAPVWISISFFAYLTIKPSLSLYKYKQFSRGLVG